MPCWQRAGACPCAAHVRLPSRCCYHPGLASSHCSTAKQWHSNSHNVAELTHLLPPAPAGIWLQVEALSDRLLVLFREAHLDLGGLLAGQQGLQQVRA